HQDGFGSLEQKATEKALLFIGCRKVIVPADGENASIIREAVKKVCPQAEIIAVEGGNKAMAEIALSAVGLTTFDRVHLHLESENITSRIDVTETLKNCIIVTDSFTNDMQSAHLALNTTVRHLTPGRHLTFILVGKPRQYDTETLLHLLKAKGVERFIGIGVNIECRGMRCEYAKTAEDFMKRYTISDFSDEVILVKGERGSGAEDIKALLEAPRHETVMEVDLGGITRNFNFFRSCLKPSTGIIAMVKASGYGVGALELAKTLQNQGASYLAVAVVDEGVELRRAGITMPIIVMNPMGTNYKALFDNHLEPSVFSIRELELLLDSASKYDITSYPVHIKLDTGMHRLGFLEDELDELAECLSQQNRVKVRSIFSHLATADCLDQNEYTQMQLDNFARMSAHLLDSLPYKAMRHILNTAGILRYPEHQYDMVRLGIGLYGVAPIDGYRLSTVARLFSTIISIKEWCPGTTIGYSRKGKVEKPSVIATVPIGYADGMNRHLSNGNAYVLVNGHKCNIIGNICMDQCMVDVTGADAQIGDKVEIFGENAPIERLSDALATIPYEILTSVSPRVKRIYFRD
ncbi:MAG: alanine racemase, partial [Muribaculaceae bacterium]|nr:alanine racemase [Muribaculaceae bacterium]